MKLLLCGGGSGKKTIEVYEKFNEIIDHTKPLLYVPLAMDEAHHPYDECFLWIKEELANVDIPGIEMVRNFDELASKNYNDYCAIFIGGGNTFKLLKGLKDSGSFEKIKDYLENDGIVYGGSAGAIIFGYNINSCLVMDPNDVQLKDTKGFNMLGGKSLFAHYTNEFTYDEHNKFKQYLLDYSLLFEKVIALPEEDTLYINDNEVEIIGSKSYYEFIEGEEMRKELNKYKFRKINQSEFDKLFDLFPDDEELWIKYREKRLEEFKNKETDTYVIEDNGKFIGEISVNYVCHDLPTEAIKNQRVYLQAFRLDKEYQGKGLGQDLIQFVLDDLEEDGYTQFTIGVEEDNEIAKHIYFKFGFTEEIDKGHGDVFDPTDYTLYMRSIEKKTKLDKEKSI